MRTVHWLFVVSVLLFVSGIAFVVASARTSRTAQSAAPAADAAIATTPAASVKQVMAAITLPAAYVIYNAVGTKSSAAGVEEIAPKNDQEWALVASNATAVMESGNLLLTGPRVVDRGDWVKMTRDMIGAGNEALKAANDKNPDAIVEAGGNLNTTCDNCHARYQR